MSNRTDVHSPLNLKPEDYEFVGCGNFATSEMDAYTPPIGYLLDEGWRFDSEGQTCRHCGHFFIYYAILQHTPSHKLVKVGETCLDNRFSLANAEFQALRKAGKLNRERSALKAKRAEFLAKDDVQELYAWASICPTWNGESFEAKFVRSIDRYGDASDKFVDAIRRAKSRQAAYETRKVQEAAEAQPVVEGRITVEGQVLSTKWQESVYGGSLKMLVKDDRGFKVWGTVPSCIDPEKGDHVAFTATVKVSGDDPNFGFFSRPTKATLTEV